MDTCSLHEAIALKYACKYPSNWILKDQKVLSSCWSDEEGGWLISVLNTFQHGDCIIERMCVGIWGEISGHVSEAIGQ